MSTYYPNTGYTLFDRLKETVDGKNMSKIIQVMNYYGVSDFFREWPAIEASHGLKHKVTRTVNVPASTRQAFDAGVRPNVTHTQSVWEDVCLFAQRRSIHDKRLETLTPSGMQQKLAMEDDSHRRALGKDVVNNIFNDTDSDGGEHINGLLSRLDTISGNNLANVVSAGFTTGGSATTRMIIVELNPNDGAYLIYPPKGRAQNNTTYGIYQEDKGKEPIPDPNDSLAIRYDYVAIFEAWLGMAVGNNLKMGAMVNINPTYGGTGAIDEDFFDKLNALLAVLDLDYSMTRIYINRGLGAQMNNYARKKFNVEWATTELFGRKVKDYMGIPVRELDNKIITNTLAVVS
jgi:hypothetical protein